MYPYQTYQPYQPIQRPQYGDLQFVNGIESARQYQLYPNNKTVLMDSNDDIFYLVSSDASGITTVKSYRFEEIPEPQPIDISNYITRQELEEMLKNYEFTAKQQQPPQPVQQHQKPNPQF